MIHHKILNDNSRMGRLSIVNLNYRIGIQTTNK